MLGEHSYSNVTIHSYKISSIIACRCIHWILDTLTLEKVYSTYVKLPTCSSPVPYKIRESTDFWPYLKDCIGAIDRSHIPTFIPELMHAWFQDENGQVLQNVLVVMFWTTLCRLLLCSSGMFCSTWAEGLRPRCLALWWWSFCFRYSVRALGLWQ